jgi:hypothetical protein
MRSLVVLLVVLASPALADTSSSMPNAPVRHVQAQPARPGYVSGTTIASKPLAHGVRVDVLDLDETRFGEHIIRVALTDGHTWWTAPDDLELRARDCRLGTCVDSTRDAMTIDEADGIAWVRFQISSTLTRNTSNAGDLDRTTHDTAVMGCTLPHDGQPPRCALYDPGVWASSSVSIRGTTLTVNHEATGPTAVVEFAL